MDNGWIKLFRKSIDSRVFQNEGLWKVWTWCLMKANHQDGWVTLKTGKGSIEVECKEGQFIFGRHSAAKELKMDPSTVWKRIQKLKNIENLTIESNRQYSTVTVLKWGVYQEREIESNNQSNKQVTSKSQASNTNKNVKNEKNVKNKPKDNGKWILPEGVDKEAWHEFELHRKEIKKPLTDLARTKASNILMTESHEDQRKIIDNSIQSRWPGLYKLKDNQKSHSKTSSNYAVAEEMKRKLRGEV